MGPIKVCSYAYGNDPVERKKLMKQDKGEFSKRMSLSVGEGLGSCAKIKGVVVDWSPSRSSIGNTKQSVWVDSDVLPETVELLFRLFLLS